jgi:hypothetical protein
MHKYIHRTNIYMRTDVPQLMIVAVHVMRVAVHVSYIEVPQTIDTFHALLPLCY